jgi:hypothetical protein
MRGFTRNVAAIGVLAEPVRRELYLFVCSQTEPVTRDQAAKAMGIAHHQAKFHLDRLEAEGLLATDYVRLTGRSGPGAGRPSKRYRRGGTIPSLPGSFKLLRRTCSPPASTPRTTDAASYSQPSVELTETPPRGSGSYESRGYP